MARPKKNNTEEAVGMIEAAATKATPKKKAKREEVSVKTPAELAEELREAFPHPGKELEKYMHEFANDDGTTFPYISASVALPFFMKDHADGRVISEVIYNTPGHSAGVKVKVYTGHTEDTYVTDGYGEAVANGITDAPLVVAHNRAIVNALKNIGYGVPIYTAYLKTAEATTLADEESGAEIIAEALETLANSSEKMSDGIIPSLEPAPKKRGRKKKEETAKAPAVGTALDIPDDFIPDLPDDVPSEMFTPAQKQSMSVWNTIPETGLSNDDYVRYLGLITEEDISSMKITFGRCAGKTIKEVAQSPSEKDSLRLYSNSSRLAGTKLKLALMKACEVYGC